LSNTTTTIASTNPRESKIFSFIEQTFYETGEFVSEQKIADRLGISLKAVQAVCRSPHFKQRLTRRGLTPPEDCELLTQEQIMCINVMLNTWDKKSLRERLKIIDVTYAQYQAWRRDPVFNNYYTKRAEQMFGDVVPTAKNRLVELVEDKNLPAIELVLEMTGTHNRRQNGDLDVVALLQTVLEILTRYVAADVLSQVAAELEILAPRILNGRRTTPVVSTTAEPEPETKEHASIGPVFDFQHH
jgi:hypothetical protein